jgi:hypothetical protein
LLNGLTSDSSVLVLKITIRTVGLPSAGLLSAGLLSAFHTLAWRKQACRGTAIVVGSKHAFSSHSFSVLLQTGRSRYFVLLLTAVPSTRLAFVPEGRLFIKGIFCVRTCEVEDP